MREVARGPASRAVASPDLFDALREHYGIRGENTVDLGGSSNLNLLVTEGGQRYVVRLYRPWVTTRRLADIQLARQCLFRGGVPCVQPIPTLKGDLWIEVDQRPLEVEPYVEYDAQMDSWSRLGQGFPLLGRTHMLLRPMTVSADGRHAPAANSIEPHDMLPMTLRAIEQIRQWDDSPDEHYVAMAAEELAHLVDQAQIGIESLPRQLVHGDYWDNNVLFRDGQIVQVADLDFMGERLRIDDLALTLYYTNSTFSDDQVSDERIRMLRTLVDAYDLGTDEPLTDAERAALPVAIARTSLAFIAMIPFIDSESGAHQMATGMRGDIAWALAIMRELARWQAGFARRPSKLSS